MNTKQKQAIEDWLQLVYRQANLNADLLDPKRKYSNVTANHIDVIASRAKQAYFNLTGKMPNQ